MLSRSLTDVAKRVKSLFDENEAPAGPEAKPEGEIAGNSLGAPKALSDLYFTEAILAVKESNGCRSLEELKARLTTVVLGQNSAETRLRCARFVIRCFFPDGLDGMARNAWAAYHDEKILSDVLRYLYLTQESVMGKCVAECLFPIENGMRVPSSLFDRFLATYYPAGPSKKTVQRLKTNLMKLGILERAAGGDDTLIPLNPSKTSLLVLTHRLFAATGPRTVELPRLLADPYWKFLGFKSETDVRGAFREADAAGLLGKYVVADRLEQITTRWSLDEFLTRNSRL